MYKAMDNYIDDRMQMGKAHLLVIFYPNHKCTGYDKYGQVFTTCPGITDGTHISWNAK